jgi:hypothetical protein
LIYSRHSPIGDILVKESPTRVEFAWWKTLQLTWFYDLFILNRTDRLVMKPALRPAIETGEPGPFPHAQT